jgi:hypothetical protein
MGEFETPRRPLGTGAGRTPQRGTTVQYPLRAARIPKFTPPVQYRGALSHTPVTPTCLIQTPAVKKSFV